MILTLDLDRSLERKLRSAALKSGTSAQTYAIGTLKEKLASPVDSKRLKRLSTVRLLEQISGGISEEEWARYSKLTAKRRREMLTGKEVGELREMSNRLETMNAVRLELVAELARRRGTTIDEELRKLGIEPRNV